MQLDVLRRAIANTLRVHYGRVPANVVEVLAAIADHHAAEESAAAAAEAAAEVRAR